MLVKPKDRVKVVEIEAEGFRRRFLLHPVPDGGVRISHFGLLANRPAFLREVRRAVGVYARQLPIDDECWRLLAPCAVATSSSSHGASSRRPRAIADRDPGGGLRFVGPPHDHREMDTRHPWHYTP